MRIGNAPLVMCAIALIAAPLSAQEASPPITVVVEAGTPADVTSPVQVTGTVNALAGDLVELDVEHVPAGSPETTSALAGKIIAFTLDTATEKPVGLKLADRVDLWFREVAGRRVVTRIALAPLPVKAAAAVTAPSDSGAPLSSATEPSAPPPAQSMRQAPAASEAPVVALSTKAAHPKPAARIPKRAADPADAPSTAATAALAGQASPEASAASQLPNASPDLNTGLTEPPSTASRAMVEIPTSSGSQGPLLLAIGLATLSGLVVLGFKLRRKEAVVGLGLAPSVQQR